MVELKAVLRDKADEDELVKAFAFDKYLLGYLFTISIRYKSDLEGGSVSVRLRKCFAGEGIDFSNNTTITEGKGNEWVITDLKKFIVKKEDGKLNTYCPKNSEYEDIRNFFSYLYKRADYSLDRLWFNPFKELQTFFLIRRDNDLLRHIKNRRGITRNLLDVDDSEDLLKQMNTMGDEEVISLFIRYLCSSELL